MAMAVVLQPADHTSTGPAWPSRTSHGCRGCGLGDAAGRCVALGFMCLYACAPGVDERQMGQERTKGFRRGARMFRKKDGELRERGG